MTAPFLWDESSEKALASGAVPHMVVRCASGFECGPFFGTCWWVSPPVPVDVSKSSFFAMPPSCSGNLWEPLCPRRQPRHLKMSAMTPLMDQTQNCSVAKLGHCSLQLRTEASELGHSGARKI